MAPAESERDVAGLGKLDIGAVAIHLQRAAEAGEMLGRPRVLAVGPVSSASSMASLSCQTVIGVSLIGREKC
jgi:hypothetical protein